MAKKKTPAKTAHERIQIVEDVVDPATGAEITIESPKTDEVQEMAKTATKKKAAPKKGVAQKKVSGSQLVRDYWQANPASTQAEIAKATGVHPSQVSQVLKREKEKAGVVEGKKRGRKPGKKQAATSNGHTSGAADQVIGFLTTAAEIGIDKSIEILQKIRSGISKTPF